MFRQSHTPLGHNTIGYFYISQVVKEGFLCNYALLWQMEVFHL